MMPYLLMFIQAVSLLSQKDTVYLQTPTDSGYDTPSFPFITMISEYLSRE